MKNSQILFGIALVCLAIMGGVALTGMAAKEYAIGQALSTIKSSTSLAYSGTACVDSDQGSMYVRGTCVDAGNPKAVFVDYCYDNNRDGKTELTEYSCVYNQCKAALPYKCVHGCKDGACVLSAAVRIAA